MKKIVNFQCKDIMNNVKEFANKFESTLKKEYSMIEEMKMCTKGRKKRSESMRIKMSKYLI